MIFELLAEVAPNKAEAELFNLLLMLSIDHGADAPSANANANFAAERFMSGRCLHWLTVVSFLTLSIAVIVLEATDIGTRCFFLPPHNVDDRDQHISPALIP